MRAAIAGDYGIEVDLQISADGEAMVHHDDALGRLTEGDGRLDQLSAAALERVPFRGTDERMMTLGELCDLVGGARPLLIELKSRFDGDGRLPARVAAVLAGYRGPAAPMSFDPTQLAVLRQKAPRLPRGIVARNTGRILLGSDAGVAALRHGLPAAGLAWRGRTSSLMRSTTCRRLRRGRAACFVPAAPDLGGADARRSGIAPRASPTR